MPWTKVFRAGTYPQGVFTATDVQQVVDNYDPADPAPLVIGHPKIDTPAFGWVSELRREGDTLLAQFGQVVAGARELVAKGLYKKLSVRLRQDEGRGWTLRHVGLLGAHPPAVEGLGPINFGEAGEGVGLEVDFAEEKKTMPTEAEIRAEERAKLEADFAASQQTLKAELAAEKLKNRRRDTEGAVDKLVAAGRVTPAQKAAGLVDFMLQLDEGAEVEFAAGEGKKTARAYFEGFLGALPKAVNFGEQFGAETDIKVEGVDFAGDKGGKVDPTRLALHKRVVEHQRANKCTYEEALAAVA